MGDNSAAAKDGSGVPRAYTSIYNEIQSRISARLNRQSSQGTLRGFAAAGKLLKNAGSGSVNVVSATHEKVRNSDPGLILCIAGFLSFIVYEKIDNFWLALIIASFFMFYSAITIFEGEGIVLVVLFFVWYVLLDGRYDLSFIRYYAAPLLLVAMAVHGLVRKFRHSGTFAEGAGGEIKGALIPIILFMLDLGLLDIFSQLRIPLEAINITFLRYVPWWGMLGLFATKKDTSFVTVLKVLTIFYLITLVFFGVAPSAVAKYQQSLVAGPQELFQARLEAQQQPKPEKPIVSYWTCLASGRLTDLDLCISEEQQKSLAKITCQNKGLSSGRAYDECVTTEINQLKKSSIGGIIDYSRKEFVAVEFGPVSKSFPKVAFEPRKGYPSVLLIKNPAQQPLDVNINCKFLRGNQEITGAITINGQESSSYSTTLRNNPLNIICMPTEDLQGNYNLKIEATLSNIVTTTVLTRVFVKTQADRDRWEQQIKSTTLSGLNAGFSSSGAELARLNYGFGNLPDDPIIIADRPVVFTASVEDLGTGQLSRVRGYVLTSLQQKGFFPNSGDLNCLQRGEIIIPQKVKSYHLTECFLELPAEYKLFEDELPFIVDTFEAQLVYDYTVTQNIPGIQVEKPS